MAKWSCCCPVEDAQNHDLAAIPQIQQHSVLESKLIEKAIVAESLRVPVEEKEVPAQKAEPMKEKEKEPVIAPAFGAFSVALPVNDHTTLGLQLETFCELGPMIQEVKSGAVASFNELHPSEALQAFDVITSIDDVNSMDVNAMFEKKRDEKKGGHLSMRIQRPKKVQLSLSKTDSLGLKMEFGSSTVGAIVREVGPEVGKGLVPTWNAKNSGEAVGENDRVIEVNKVQHFGEDLMKAIQQIEKNASFSLTVLKY